MSKLEDSVRSFIAGSVGNRVYLLGKVLLVGGIVSASHNEKMIMDPYQFMAVSSGALFCASTFCGYGTRKLYNRTREHIRRFGKLNPKFVKNVIRRSQQDYPGFDLLIGYCQEQGAYLAARDMGQLGAFNDAKTSSRNIIPNF